MDLSKVIERIMGHTGLGFWSGVKSEANRYIDERISNVRKYLKERQNVKRSNKEKYSSSPKMANKGG